jgi:hypothetical protein
VKVRVHRPRDIEGHHMIIESGIKHVAYFWFKDDTSKDEALSLVQEMATSIPNVQRRAGRRPGRSRLAGLAPAFRVIQVD